MATDLPCDVCQSNPTQLVITMTATGDTVGVCARCVLPWAKQLDKEIRDLERAVNGPAEAAQEAVQAMDPPDVDTRPARAPKARKRTLQLPGGPVMEEVTEATPADD